MRIILNGACGHMGRIVRRLVEAAPDLELVATVDAVGEDRDFANLADCNVAADCVIDFSHHSATAGLVDFITTHHMPVVLCTTGQTPEERDMIRKAAAEAPVFFSATMSPAVTMLAEMAANVAKMFPEADVEIIERHHNRKVDVPSGTALIFANAIKEVREGSELVIGRHENGRRKPTDISIHSLRMGNEVGSHEIIFATGTQNITLRHDAEDRALFAEGALKAARYIVKCPNGLYNMKDLIRSE